VLYTGDRWFLVVLLGEQAPHTWVGDTQTMARQRD
jgi:hypothetical protein